MEFDMFTTTKQDSIIIAVTLAIILSLPLLVPAVYPTYEVTVPSEAASSPNNGVAQHSVKLKGIEGDQCKSLRIVPHRPAHI